jgi:hypothetical protein
MMEQIEHNRVTLDLQALGQWSVGLDLSKVRNMDNQFGTEGVGCPPNIF